MDIDTSVFGDIQDPLRQNLSVRDYYNHIRSQLFKVFYKLLISGFCRLKDRDSMLQCSFTGGK